MSGRNFNITDKIAVTGATNTGTGVNVFDSKTADNLQFRSISTGQNMFATPDSGSIRIDGVPIIPDRLSLPSSPNINDIIFYGPLSIHMVWTGIDWQENVTYLPLFWQPGNVNASVYLNIGNSINGFSTSTPYGFFIPNFGAAVTEVKILGLAVANTGLLTGQFELHQNSTIDPPNFSVTGLGNPVVFNNETSRASVFTTIPVSPIGSFLQCFWRRTAGTSSNVQAGILFARRITP